MDKQKTNTNRNRVKLMCSYGGKIQPRPIDHQLCYIGGDIKILAVDRNIKFSEMADKLNSLCNINNNSEVCIKYQLPGEDLDSLVSLINDEDIEHMMVEYDRMVTDSAKPARLRLFIFDLSGPGMKNLAPGAGTSTPLNPDYLFGFDKEYQPSVEPPMDILQIPAMVLPENYGSPKIDMANNGNAAEVYRIPVVTDGGGPAGQFRYGVVPGAVNFNGGQPLYNFVAVTPSFAVAELPMMTSMENSHGMKINHRNF